MAQIASIYEIHSVDINFVSKKNEDYHRQQLINEENKRNKFASKAALKTNKPSSTYDPNAQLGLDPVLGDIIFEPSEIPIVRGGWYDRNTVYYSDNIEDKGLRSINIIKKSSIDPSHRQQI